MNIIKQLNNLGMRNYVIAKKTNTSRQHITNIANGRRLPSVVLAAKLAALHALEARKHAAN